MGKKKKRQIIVGFDPGANGDSYAVATERMRDGTMKVHKAKPFLKPAFEEYQEQLIEHIRKAYAVPGGLLASIPRTPAKGIVHAWSSTPACPFPYGTIIKPKPTYTVFPDDRRHMVIGARPDPMGDTGIVMSIDVTPGSEVTAYQHLLENMTELWEEDD